MKLLKKINQKSGELNYPVQFIKIPLPFFRETYDCQNYGKCMRILFTKIIQQYALWLVIIVLGLRRGVNSAFVKNSPFKYEKPFS